MNELELEVRVDRIGNIFCSLHSGSKDGTQRLLMIGSHIDTVKNAATLDGTYGVLAGWACGVASPQAWTMLQPCIDTFMTVSDDDAVTAMQRLAVGSVRDIPVLSGESGAAGLAGLMTVCQQIELARAIGLDSHSPVLLINTEGATAPSVCRELVGEAAESVLDRQRA